MVSVLAVGCLSSSFVCLFFSHRMSHLANKWSATLTLCWARLCLSLVSETQKQPVAHLDFSI